MTKTVTVDGVEVPIESVDILIVGSGPIGATFARTLVDNGRKVAMIDLGERGTRRVGDHKKNSVAAQKDISLFTNVVRGELHNLSVPTNFTATYLEPSSWDPTPDELAFIQNGQNPLQIPWNNIPSAAASRVVGGMGSHWTCCTPRQHKLERSDLFTDDEWEELYNTAEELFSTNSTSFDDSIRQQLVKHVLGNTVKDREIFSMPLACKRPATNKDYVEWTCTGTILGILADPKYSGDEFEIRPNTQCLRLVVNPSKRDIGFAVVKDILLKKTYAIRANKYVVAAGATLTPGILFNSDLTFPALGRYLTEQTMAFCQVVLKRDLVNDVETDAFHIRGWKEKVAKHHRLHPKDPLPFPFDDPDPQVYYPFTESHPWHTQIHRDAFGYGEVPPTIDQRLVVDFRWFSATQPNRDNLVEFSKDVQDEFGMPQPTYKFRITDKKDIDICNRMITDMVEVARNLGGFLPGAEPKYLQPGSALHICGTYRAGISVEDSVVDRTGKVWDIDNLVLGGCGVIPTGSACNPTLTAACFAIAAARQMVKELNA